jgi:hypothetical protein
MNIIHIIKELDSEIVRLKKAYLTAVEANEILAKKGLLKDSSLRPGKPLRDLLRKGHFPHAYQNGTFWYIPLSSNKAILNEQQKKQGIATVAPDIDKNSIEDPHKLTGIAEVAVEIIFQLTGIRPSYMLELKPQWLESVPNNEVLKPYWNQVLVCYSKLTEGKYELNNRLKLCKKGSPQSYDIWISEPFNFAIEFDEKQHFNQFRKVTLEHYSGIPVAFDLVEYKSYCQGMSKPGSSGFQRLKAYDPLFPPIETVTQQDNRIRQRAFRDFLKDVYPIAVGYGSTVRVPYQIVNKINNFSESDFHQIRNHMKNQFLAKPEIVSHKM